MKGEANTVKKLLVALFLALFAFPAFAQNSGTNVTATAFLNYDLNATAITYGSFGPLSKGPFFLTTVGSSTTVTAVSGTPFDILGVGDQLQFIIAGVPTYRFVTAIATNASLTINTAITLTATTGQAWSYRKASIGTAITNGWINVSNWSNKFIKVNITTMTGTGGIDMQAQCRMGGDGSDATNIYTTVINYAAAGGDFEAITEPCSSVRVGIFWHTADTVGTDDITITVNGTAR